VVRQEEAALVIQQAVQLLLVQFHLQTYCQLYLDTQLDFLVLVALALHRLQEAEVGLLKLALVDL
jgi:hypothetical protein